MIELWQIFIDPNNIVFAVCLTVCGLVLALEFLGLVIGFSNHWVDDLLPDALKADVNLDVDGAANSVLVTLSSWIYLGRMPFLIWLFIFFGGFGVTGIVLQSLSLEFLNKQFIPSLAVSIAFVVNLFVTHGVCRAVSRIIPKDEVTTIKLKELVGLNAEIVIGVAKPNYPAQAKVKDQFGTTHYIMVVPHDETEYKQGDQLVVFEQKEKVFTVISKEKLENLSK